MTTVKKGGLTFHLCPGGAPSGCAVTVAVKVAGDPLLLKALDWKWPVYSADHVDQTLVAYAAYLNLYNDIMAYPANYSTSSMHCNLLNGYFVVSIGVHHTASAIRKVLKRAFQFLVPKAGLYAQLCATLRCQKDAAAFNAAAERFAAALLSADVILTGKVGSVVPGGSTSKFTEDVVAPVAAFAIEKTKKGSYGQGRARTVALVTQQNSMTVLPIRGVAGFLLKNVLIKVRPGDTTVYTGDGVHTSISKAQLARFGSKTNFDSLAEGDIKKLRKNGAAKALHAAALWGELAPGAPLSLSAASLAAAYKKAF